MQKNKRKNISDYKFIIEDAIRLLPDGDGRFSITEFPLRYTNFNDFFKPDFSEQISSDYGLPSKNPQIEKDFFEEIKMLEELLRKYDTQIDLSDWQKTKNENGEKLYKDLNRRAYAMQIWDWYAIPWRFKNGFIHIILAPKDVMGTPIIYSLAPKDFLISLARIEENQMQSFVRNQKQLNIWKTIGQIFIFICCIILFVYVLKLF